MDTREQIKEAARELFAKQGYDGVSVRDIIHKAKVNLGAVTYHFGSKEELYEEMILEMGSRLRENLEKISVSRASSSEKLEWYIRTFMTMLFQNPTHARMMIREMGMGGKRFMGIIQPFAQINFGTLRNILEEGMRKKEFKKMDPSLVAFSILALCVHFINVQPMILRFSGRIQYDEGFVEKVIEHTVQFALQALKGK